MRLPRALLLLPPLLASCQTAYTECTRDLEGCYEVASGRYLALEPADTDADLPVVLYFHGHNSSAAAQLERYGWFEGVLQARGWLTILPDGDHNTWSHPGSPHAYRDDLAFVAEVLDDVEARWPVQAAYASGFSQGASMAWYAACAEGERFAAFFPASGSFWEPMPETCTHGPIDLRHTHGTSDQTFPLDGRDGVAGDYSQASTWEGMALWRTVNGCAEAPDREEVQGAVTCSSWESCESGKTLRLCLHDGGHAPPTDWMAQNLDWVEDLSALR